MTPDEAQDFVSRYVMQWNETSPDARKAIVHDLWAENATDYTTANEYRGHTEIEQRVARASQKYVQDRGCLFRLRGTPSTLYNSIKLYWEMVEDSRIASVGFDFLILDETGHISTAYQFIEQ